MSALEEVFQDCNNNAVYVYEVHQLSAKLAKLYLVNCELAAPGDQHKLLRCRYLKVKAHSEVRQEAKAIPIGSIHGSEDQSQHSSRSSSPSHHARTSRVKLPKIDLPQFDGNSLNWPSFWERFSTAVDQNDELSDDEKLAHP